MSESGNSTADQRRLLRRVQNRLLPNEPRPSSVQPIVPDHDLVGRIGSGSYGEVWLARNQLGTYRAVKAVRRDSFPDVRPFERELAGIRSFEPISRSHPGVVDILQVGLNREGGYFYYVMEAADDVEHGQIIEPISYVPRTLAWELRRRGRRPFDQCVEVALMLSSALAHLHAHRLVHRDVKPSNVVFVDGVPKLADVGLVAAIDEARSYVGTEGYIPLDGPGTPQADIYSLGKVLYELASGNDRCEFPSWPADLEQLPDRDRFVEFNEVIVKACHHQKHRRYQSARQLHDDLLLLQQGGSVRRLRALEKRWRVARTFSVIGSAVLFVGGATYYEVAREQRLLAENRQRQVGTEIAKGSFVMETGDLLGALPPFVEALRLDQGRPEREATHRLRLGALLDQCPKLTQLWAASDRVNDLAFSLDGEAIAVGQQAGAVHIVNSATGLPLSPPFGVKFLLESVSFSPDRKRVATANQDGNVILWDAVAGTELLRLMHPDSVLMATFSRDGGSILTACWDGKARLWDAMSGELLREFASHTGPVCAAAFSRDEVFVVTASHDRSAQVWNARTSVRVGLPMLHKNWVYSACFSPDGKRLATAGFDRRVRLWDATTCLEIPTSIVHGDAVRSVEFSPDGRYLLTASWDSTARLWDVATGHPIRQNPVLRHSDRVMKATFSPDGRRIATACVDGTVRIWDLAVAQIPPEPITGLISPDGALFLRASNNWVELRSVDNRHPHEQRLVLEEPIQEAVFSQNSRFVLIRSGPSAALTLAPSTLHVFSLTSGQPLGPPIACTNSLETVWLSDSGSRVAWASGSNVVVSGLSVGSPLTAVLSHPRPVTMSRFDSEGRRLITVAGRFLDLWDLMTSKRVIATQNHDLRVNDVEFSPDGRFFLTCTSDNTLARGTAQVWDAATGQPVGAGLSHRDGVLRGAFSPDGRRIVTASEDSTAIIWSAASGKPLCPPLRHDDHVQGAIFSSSDNWVLTASLDRTARVWDAETGAPLTPPLAYPKMLRRAHFLVGGEELVGVRLTHGGWRSGLPRETRPVEDLFSLAQLLNGCQDLLAEIPAAARAARLRELWRRLRERHPETFVASPPEIIAWHRREADKSEEEERWQACLFHLNTLAALQPDDQTVSERWTVVLQKLAQLEQPSPGR
jgi:WD40 repeat protein